VRPRGFYAMFRPLMRTRLLLAALLPLLACSSNRVSFTGEIRYAKTAEENYEAGVDEMKHENWTEAGKFYEHVRTKYPFSKYAALAELRQADAKFLQSRYTESADAYTAFVTAHPTHEEADYAAYRAALSRTHDAPADFMLFPPAYEKDQKSLRSASELLVRFVKERPDAKQLPEARKLLAEVNGKLADHEAYVAEFYWKRERWAGAAMRYEGLVRDFPGARQEPEALLRMGQAYARLDEKFRAQQALQKLLARHPQDPRRAEAEKLLERLR
jgi:outer membrane protein assembly factor BamD